MTFSTIISEGNLVPADLLAQIATGEAAGQHPTDFGFERSRRLTDEIAAAWADARAFYTAFQRSLRRLSADDAATTVTRERWIVPLLETLGYTLTFHAAAAVVGGRTYAISHRAGADADAPPVHIEGMRRDLDRRGPAGRPRLSPHALVQEYLNATEHLWGIVTNGERLRLLRDSSRTVRPVYVEFDLQAMLEGEKFSEFALLYRLLHRTRLPQTMDDAAQCLLEAYHQQAIVAGGRVRDGLRDGVEAALRTLGDGLLRHAHSSALRQKIAAGQLSPLDYYRQLLRLVYRLLFLMVAEERRLLAASTPVAVAERDAWIAAALPDQQPEPSDGLAIYYQHYSVSRLRHMAERVLPSSRHDDLWLGLLATFRLLEDDTASQTLGIAALDGDLFGPSAMPDIASAALDNATLLRAIRALSLYHDAESRTLRRVNYAALDVEELGSVYESLLDYRPVVEQGTDTEGTRQKGEGKSSASGDSADTPDPAQGASSVSPSPRAFSLSAFAFRLVSGTERKTTGSYYTRPELVQELITSALEPVIAQRLAAAPEQAAQAQALLTLKVVDPACGSGHFLLAAARRIARELARVRSGEDQPSPTVFRAALREVIARCIYGVDANPLAVDLCKVALWLESLEPGKPLSFLDSKIRWGNSLVGATEALVAQGIPDAAYKPVTGDDKQAAAAFRKRNSTERKAHAAGQAMLPLFASDAASDALGTLAQRLNAMPDDDVAAVRRKAERFAQLRARGSLWYATWTRFNLWTAAFFTPLTDAGDPLVPTSDNVFEAERNPAHVRGDLVGQASKLAHELGFFHWELEFPEVFEAGSAGVGSGGSAGVGSGGSAGVGSGGSGGFDVVLGNPPWERIKLQEQEHWVDVPAVAQAANKAARQRTIDQWRNGTPQQQARVALFDTAKYRAEAESRFVRASGRFALTAVGDVNTYALFAEHARDLLAPTGRAGVIVPTGIATDDTTKRFFGDLVEKQALSSYFGFKNERFLFARPVEHTVTFGLLNMLGSALKAEKMEFCWLAYTVPEMQDMRRRITLQPQDFALLNPNTRTCPVFRTETDAELTKQIYCRVPVLVDERTDANPWGVSFLRMFDMSNDSGLFRDAPGAGLLPLYEAKLLHQFTHRWATYEQGEGHQAQGKSGPAARNMTTEELRDPATTATPRYWVAEEAVAERLAGRWDRGWLLGFRDIARATDERTAIFSLLPPVAVGHTAPILFLSSADTLLYACFLAVANSTIFDFVVRQKMGGTHLTFTVVNQLPVLPPSAFSAADIAFIVPRVLELVYTAWDMQAFAEDVWRELEGAGEGVGRAGVGRAGVGRAGVGRAGVGRAGWGVTIKKLIWQQWSRCNEQQADQFVPGSAGMAERDDAGGTLLSPHAQLSPRGTLGNDQPDPPRSDRDPSEHRRRRRAGEPERLHPLSPDRPGVAEGTGNPSASERTLPDHLSGQHHAAADGVHEPGQDAPHADSSSTGDDITSTTPADHQPPLPTANSQLPFDYSQLPPTPFQWNDERRAVIRAELDARIARLYGLTRDELRYILDPADVHGPDFPGETFRVIKEKETKQHGEFRTRRLVLAAWDADEAA